MQMKFSEAPVGARFKYPNCDSIWVKINSYPESIGCDGRGLVVQWNGNVIGFQSYCSFVDEENGITLDSLINVVE